jgi:hypothetical protein
LYQLGRHGFGGGTAIKDCINEVIEQLAQLGGLDFIGAGFGAGTVFLDQLAGLVENLGLLEQLADPGDGLGSDSHGLLAMGLRCVLSLQERSQLGAFSRRQPFEGEGK